MTRLGALALAAALAAAALAAALPEEPPPLPLEEIVRRFAEKEIEYARAHALYDYRLSIKIQEFDEHNKLKGEFEQAVDVTTDPSGRRVARPAANPRADLDELNIKRLELEDLERFPLFLLGPADIPRYDVTYLGRELVGEAPTYLFRLEPKPPWREGEHLFDGVVNVDADQLDVVRAAGKLQPLREAGAFGRHFQHVEVYREPVGGALFPTYMRADAVLALRENPVTARLVLRFSEHKKARDLPPPPPK